MIQLYCIRAKGMMMMKITDVRLKKVDGHNRLKAIASVTIDDCFVIHELRIIEGDNGLFIAMPSRKLPEGEFKDIAHPINAETRKMFEDAIFEEYNKAE